MSRLYAYACCVAIVTALWTTTVHADNFNGLGIAPGPVIANRDPGGLHYNLGHGETIIDSLKLINTTSEQKYIQLRAVDAIITTDNRLICPPTDSTPSKWVRFDKQSVLLVGNSVLLEPFTLQVPAHGNGEYNLCLIGQEAIPAKKGAIPLTSRLAMRLSVITGANPKIASRLSKPMIVISSDQIAYRSTINNLSSVSTSTIQRAHLTGPMTDLTYNSPKQLLLPKAEGVTGGTFKRPIAGGWYQLTITATSQQSISSWSRTSKSSEQQVICTIFVWPHKGIMVSIGLLSIIVTALIYKKSRQKRD